ncbi:MAG: hypothetical protein JSR67_12960 [Proteobacteria bacterium]|nr:hypothetical protein [Pseudomonadota bacterium]
MIDLFAAEDTKADRAYINIRTAAREGSSRARAHCEELWRDFAPYASKQFIAEFPYHLHQRWHEMYLAVSLLHAGLDIQCPAEGAPDVRVQYCDGRVLWIEAIAPTGGEESNPDRVVYPRQEPGDPPVAYSVPTDQVTMRVSGALRDKAAKLKTYRDEGVIAPDDQAIVAINVHDIPHGFYDAERYAFAATYGVGPQYVVLDRDSGAAVESGFQHRPQIQRSSGAPVDLAPFLHADFAHVAGALVSAADAANYPTPLGLDFMLLPNPNALPAYTASQLPIGREWRLAPAAGDGYNIVEIIEHQARR